MVLGFNAKSNEPNSAIIADNYGTAGTSGRQGGEAPVSIKPSYNKIETVSSGKPTCLIDQICILYTFVTLRYMYFILHGSNASTHLWTMRAELIYRPFKTVHHVSEIYQHISCAHFQLYPHASVKS